MEQAICKDIKISVSTGTLQEIYGEKEALKIAKKAGADGVDFNLWSRAYDYKNPDSIYAKSDAEIYDYFKNIKDFADEIGIEIFMTHGQGTGYINDEIIDNNLIENVRRDCIATGALGAEYCVLHTAGNYHLPPETPADLMHLFNKELFEKGGVFAKAHNIKLVTETFGSSSRYGCIDFFGDYKNFENGLNNIKKVYPEISVCVDTGHTNLTKQFNQPSVDEVIRKLGKNITCLHLHDNSGFKDEHKVLGSGNIDWEKVFTALNEIDYKGVFNLEIVLTHYGEDFIFEELCYGIKTLKQLLKNHYKKTTEYEVNPKV